MSAATQLRAAVLAIAFLGLNSAWEIDHHFKQRASINDLALARGLGRVLGRRLPDAAPDAAAGAPHRRGAGGAAGLLNRQGS